MDRLSCVRFGSARYSVPTRLIGRAVEVQVLGAEVRVLHFGELVAVHQLVTPGETSVKDEHYGACWVAERRPRPRTAVEKAICGLGNVGEDFIKGAAAAGLTAGSAPSWPTSPPWRPPTAGRRWWRPGPGRQLRPLPLRRRALHPGRRPRGAPARPARRGAGGGPAQGARAPPGRVRHRRWGMSTTAPPLPAYLEAGLRRLKLATFRRNAPELLQDAKAQRWAPEVLLRALVEAEVAARDASMAAARLKAAGFPVKKSFEDFDFSASSIPRATLDYLAKFWSGSGPKRTRAW